MSGDGIMALAVVEGTNGSDAADLLIGLDLVEKFGQHGFVSDIASGELRSPDFECFLVNADVDVAPDTAFCPTVLAGVPFSFALVLDLDAFAVDQQVQWAA